MKDDQDFVKLYIMDTLVTLAQFSSPQVNYCQENKTIQQKLQNNVIVFLKPLAEDPSWRTRYTVADKIADLAKIFGKQQTKTVLLPFFVKFLQDSESEVISFMKRNLLKIDENYSSITIGEIRGIFG